MHRFGPFVVDPAAFRLTRDNEPVHIEPKALEVLVYLIAHRDRVVRKNELLDAVWHETFVTPNALTRAIAHLRKTLGDDAESPRYIETIPTRGYRFIGTSEAPPAIPQPVVEQPAATAVPQRVIPLSPAPSRRHRTCLVIASVLVAAVIFAFANLVIAIFHARSRIAGNLRGSGSTQIAARRLLRPQGLHAFPALSPDGTRIAYSSDRSGLPQIHVSLANGQSETPLTSEDDGAIEPAWSPDGRLIAYTSFKRGGIRIVDLSGGTPRELTKFGSRASWSPDGNELAFQSAQEWEFGGTAFDAQPRSTIWIADLASGHADPLTLRGHPPGGHGAPSWSPDGRRLAFSSCEIEHCVIYTIGRDGSSLTDIDRNSVPLASPVFSRNGRTLYYLLNRYDGSVLLARPVSPDGKPAGSSRTIRHSRAAVMQHLTSSRNGSRFAWSSTLQSSNLNELRFDQKVLPAAKETTLVKQSIGRASFPAFSPDGKKIAWSAVGAGDDSGIWVAEADGENAKPLSAAPHLKQHITWSQDGSEISYAQWQEGPAVFAVSLLDGHARVVARLPHGASSPVVSPDRTRVAFNRTLDGKTAVWAMTLDGSDLRRLTDELELARLPVWSPSGKQVAVQVRRPDGSAAVGVVPAEGGALRILTSGGEHWPYSWSPDERFIAAAVRRDGVWNLWSIPVRGGDPRRLTDNDSAARWMRYPVWSPDGKRVIFESGVISSEIWVSNPAVVE